MHNYSQNLFKLKSFEFLFAAKHILLNGINIANKYSKIHRIPPKKIVGVKKLLHDEIFPYILINMAL